MDGDTIFSTGMALLGVIISVILTNIFNKSMNVDFENRNMGKRIYYRIFTDLKYCFLTETAFRKGHDTAEIISINDLKVRVENVFKENIEYLDKDLFSIYHQLISDKYFENLGGETFRNIEYLKIFSELLTCIYTVLKKHKMVDKILLGDINELMYSYKVWHLLLEKLQSEIMVEQILMMKWQFKSSFYEIYINKSIQRLLKDVQVYDETFAELFIKACGSIGDK